MYQQSRNEIFKLPPKVNFHTRTPLPAFAPGLRLLPLFAAFCRIGVSKLNGFNGVGLVSY
jgi:hypothetical protein